MEISKLKITIKNSKLFWLCAAGAVLIITVGVSFWLREEISKESNIPETDDPFLLGQYYFNHGNEADGTYDLKKARKYFEAAITTDPSASLLAWYQLGRIDFLEGDFDAAIYKFQKQLQYFDDQLPNVYYMLGLTYGYKARETKDGLDWRKAEENFLKYLEYDLESPWTRLDLSWVYFSQGKYEEMRVLLEPVLELHKSNPWFLNMYALSLLNTGERGEAQKYFKQAASLADGLTPENWGQTYPGNDPEAWSDGLNEFKRAIKMNIEVSAN